MINIDEEYITSNVYETASTECWVWNGYCNPDGYGQRKINGTTVRMHRASYEVFIGAIPEGMHVLHKCDNPSCINPQHLFLGTHSDNMQDMWNKGRHAFPTAKPGAKLSVKDVRDIKRLKGTISALALSKRYPVNGQTIRNIWNGTCWREVNEKPE